MSNPDESKGTFHFDSFSIDYAGFLQFSMENESERNVPIDSLCFLMVNSVCKYSCSSRQNPYDTLDNEHGNTAL